MSGQAADNHWSPARPTSRPFALHGEADQSGIEALSIEARQRQHDESHPDAHDASVDGEPQAFSRHQACAQVNNHS
jgi:hypothetical protein